PTLEALQRGACRFRHARWDSARATGAGAPRLGAEAFPRTLPWPGAADDVLRDKREACPVPACGPAWGHPSPIAQVRATRRRMVEPPDPIGVYPPRPKLPDLTFPPHPAC